MNRVPLFLIIVSLSLLLGGCGEKGVNYDELDLRSEPPNVIFYIKGSDTPYTGKAFTLYESGQKMEEVSYKNGKWDGLYVSWYRNGQKNYEGNYKGGKLVEGSEKFWNSKGEPVDSSKEAK